MNQIKNYIIDPYYSLNDKSRTIRTSLRFFDKKKAKFSTCKKALKLKNIFLEEKKLLLLKIRKDFIANKDYKDIENNFIRAMNYKNNLKKINSSFSKESSYNYEKKMMKVFSSKNILFNDSLFSNKKFSLKKLRLNKDFIDSNENNSININNDKILNNPKYVFKENTNLEGRTININELSQQLDEMEKEMDQIIYCNLNKHYTTYFSITDRAKYDSKFKSPFFNDKEEKNEQIKRIEKYKNLINPNVYKEHLKLLENLKEDADKIDKENILKKIKVKKGKKLNPKTIKERFINTVMKISQYLKNTNLSENEIMKFKIIEQSFTYPETYLLIKEIQYKNLHSCYKILNSNKNIILDFDFFMSTPLHWAVKKNFYQFLPKLLDSGAMVDAHNMSGDTPLHIAAKNNYYDCACILLYYFASPSVKNKLGKMPIDLTNDYDMKRLMEKGTKLFYSSYFQRNLIQGTYIQSGLWTFIKEEFKNKITEEVFEYFKGKEIEDIFTLKY